MSKQDKASAQNPFTEEKLNEYNFLTNDQINAKINESWNAFQQFRNSNPKERVKKLHKLSEIIERDREKCARIISLEMGKPIKESRLEVDKAIDECRFFAKHLEEFCKPEKIPSKSSESYIYYQPLGVIYHITPFNFPIYLIFRGTIAALAMGNTVVNKNPQTCPQCGIFAEEAFIEAGFNNGEFINLIVNQEASDLIISNPSIRGVSFTGSTSGGKHVAESAGKYCKKTVMELGGSDPYIVLNDADLNMAVKQAIEGRLLNGGQCCTASKRFIIHESIYEDFKNKLLDGVKKIRIGNPLEEDTDLGPLAKRSTLEGIEKQVKKAREKGDKLLYGGERPREEHLRTGHFFQPTVFEVSEDSPLFKEETFGPVFALLKFRNDEDAIRIANNTVYGLGGSVFSSDKKRALEVAKEIEAGAIYINAYVDWDVCTPEGGIKESGFGRDGGKQSAYEFVNTKTISFA